MTTRPGCCYMLVLSITILMNSIIANAAALYESEDNNYGPKYPTVPSYKNQPYQANVPTTPEYPALDPNIIYKVPKYDSTQTIPDPSLSLRPSHLTLDKNSPYYRQGSDPYYPNGQTPKYPAGSDLLNVNSKTLGLDVGVAQPQVKVGEPLYREDPNYPNRQTLKYPAGDPNYPNGQNLKYRSGSDLLNVNSNTLGLDVGVGQPKVTVGEPLYREDPNYPNGQTPKYPAGSDLLNVNSKTLGLDVGVAQPNVNVGLGGQPAPYPHDPKYGTNPEYPTYPTQEYKSSDLLGVKSSLLGLNVGVGQGSASPYPQDPNYPASSPDLLKVNAAGLGVNVG